MPKCTSSCGMFPNWKLHHDLLVAWCIYDIYVTDLLIDHGRNIQRNWFHMFSSICYHVGWKTDWYVYKARLLGAANLHGEDAVFIFAWCSPERGAHRFHLTNSRCESKHRCWVYLSFGGDHEHHAWLTHTAMLLWHRSWPRNWTCSWALLNLSPQALSFRRKILTIPMYSSHYILFFSISMAGLYSIIWRKEQPILCTLKKAGTWTSQCVVFLCIDLHLLWKLLNPYSKGFFSPRTMVED